MTPLFIPPKGETILVNNRISKAYKNFLPSGDVVAQRQKGFMDNKKELTQRKTGEDIERHREVTNFLINISV